MKYILLSGGSGKRLWPLSNDVQSKQFIKLLKNKDGVSESMLQRIYSQILSVDLNAEITIATSMSQVPLIKKQLGKHVGISVEPSRRDTFPAILLASLYLHDKLLVNDSEVITVCPVDSYVNNSFFEKIIELQNRVKNNDVNIGLLGIEPTYPSSKYGYIVIESENDKGIFKVNKFVEKPTESDANKLIDDGALWNSGVFCFKLKYIIEKAHSIIDFVGYEDFYEKYNSIEKISFDYKVVENEKKILVVKFIGDWSDIGTWNTFTEVMTDNNIGKVLSDGKCVNTHIINELDIPIIAMGLKNIVIVSSHDGIFVSDKNESSYNKKLVDKLENRPMYEERVWGNIKILELNKTSLTKHLKINKGKMLSYQKHNFRDETWTIISGNGIFVLNDKEKNVKVGDVLIIKQGQKHTIKAIDELHIIEVQIGEYLFDDDIERFDY